MSFGRYRTGTALAWRLDPRTKLAFSLVLLLGCFQAVTWAHVALLAAAAVAALAAAGGGVRDAVRALRPFLWLMAFVLVFDAAFSPQGIAYAARTVACLAAILVGTSTLMTTTSPTELAGAVVLVLSPLARLGVPVEDVGLAVSMTLRFVPSVIDELGRVRMAQEARLARFEEGGIRTRVRALTTLLPPVFASVLRRSRNLALALELRGYGRPDVPRRTHLREYHLSATDCAVLALTAALAVTLLAT